MSGDKLSFASDYMEGAHPDILKKLIETNMIKSPGYGADPYSESARNKIRKACRAEEAEVRFLIGGTQANATVISAMLQPWQGVIAAETGHISTHEAGAVEYGGHKVLTLPHDRGKLSHDTIDAYINQITADENKDHMVMPGMVYISQPTEYGTLYSLDDLKRISSICGKNNLKLYLDGARLAYALGCPENTVGLKDIADLCDAFYIGGTKCGALFGEAVVIPGKNTIPHFFTIIKQRGALLAKGRIAGIQFDTLFENGLYEKLGQNAVQKADRIRSCLRDKGYTFYFESPTNQIFLKLPKEDYVKMKELVEMSFWENVVENGKEFVVVRIATSWATSDKDVDQLRDLLDSL